MSEQRVLQVGVKILIQNNQGEVLLLRRSLDKYPDVCGRWDIPGGRIDIGTELISNLAREVKEETGLKLVGNPELLGAQDILRNEKKHVVRLTYKGFADGEVFLDLKEHDEHCWYAFDQLHLHNDLDMYLTELLKNHA